MKEENLISVDSLTTLTTTGGSTTTNIIYDEAGTYDQYGTLGTDPTQTIVGNTVWRSQAFISPAEPEGIGALGEIHTDDNGYRFVYTKEGWIQVVNVIGPGLWQQLHGKEEETKCEKKKLKCF